MYMNVVCLGTIAIPINMNCMLSMVLLIQTHLRYPFIYDFSIHLLDIHKAYFPSSLPLGAVLPLLSAVCRPIVTLLAP